MPIYQLTRGTIAWRDGRYSRGEVIIDPPEFVLGRFGDDLLRLDDSEGRFGRETLETLPYDDVREIAAHTEGVDHAQPRAGLVDDLARDGEDTGDDGDATNEQTIEEQAARVARELDQRGEAPMFDGPGEGGGEDDEPADPEAVEAEKEAILDELAEDDVDVSESEEGDETEE